jgi:putative transposase
MSQRHACRLIGIARSTKRYCSRSKDRELGLRQRLGILALERSHFRYQRLRALLEREGQKANHKCIYWLYRAEGLIVRRRRRKQLARGSGIPSALLQ